MMSIPFHLDPDGGTPLYRQIEEQLRAAILDGRLRAGMRVPSVRGLAAQLGVARITVVTAYEQLVAEGYLVGRRGYGTTVAPDLPERWMRVRTENLRRRRQAGRQQPRLPTPARHAFAHSFFEQPNPFVARETMVDFSTGSTSLDLFPTDIWERTLRRAWKQLSSENRGSSATTYLHPHGDPLLRQALADYLGASRAVRCTADDVVVTAGAQGAMKAAVRLWLDGDRIYAVEDPGGPHLWRTFQVSGARMVGVPTDASGLRIDRLPAAAALALVTPSWQYPSGGTLPLTRRMELLSWASGAGAVVIEDDCDSELRYQGHSLPALQGLDEEGRVLYVGTFSKVLYPGLRTGYAVAPAAARSAFGAMVEAGDRGPGAIEQRALAIFLVEGHFERHLRRLRIAFAARQEALVEAVRRHFSDLLVVEPAPAGTHLVARITDPSLTATAVAEMGAAAGILVEPLGHSRIAPAPDDRLLIHYARHPEQVIDQGMAMLARAVRDGRHDVELRRRSA